jgi:predicted dehydrogenase
MPEPLKAVLLGAGGRGYRTFGGYAEANPEKLDFIAVAEPDEARRRRFAKAHDIPAEMCFTTWEDLLDKPQLAPALVNATMDRMHIVSTLPALKAGYHVLLEKPMAVTAENSMRLVKTAEAEDRILQIGHVMRYAPFYVRIRDLVQSDRLGRVITVDHRENVAYWHMAHSFVRGNWGNSGRSAPMILAKSCHDLDILLWILGKHCLRVSSVGHLTHYVEANAGPDIPERCTDGCPRAAECPWYAPRLYLTGDTSWPTAAISVDMSLEARREALETGPYGRCVYRCDNDVVDHQIVTMELEDEVTVSFTMHGHGYYNKRTSRFDGSCATLLADQKPQERLWILDHLSGERITIELGAAQGGHGGGDRGIVDDFIAAVRNPGQEVKTSARQSLESHLIAFAAEKARATNTVVDMQAYTKEIEERVEI